MKCDIDCGVQAKDVDVDISTVFITKLRVNKPITKKEATEKELAVMEDNFVEIFDVRYAPVINRNDRVLQIPEIRHIHYKVDEEPSVFKEALEHFKNKEEVTEL